MQIVPLAAESLGTRGFSLFVVSEDRMILIDPSVSLGPFRNGYPPHLREIAASYLSRQYIKQFWELADIIIQTHYHADHFSLRIRRPYEFINLNQKKRAKWLWKRKKVPLYSADGNTFIFGRTRIFFSKALPHGKIGSKRGWVVSVVISDSFESVLITSDVSGPGSDEALNFIIENPCDLVILDGPTTYHPKEDIIETEKAFNRLLRIIESSSVIIDHHLLRDFHWEQNLTNYGISIKDITLAHLIKLPPMCLESIRAQLYTEYPLESTFHKKFELNDPEVMKDIKDVADLLPQKFKFERIVKESFITRKNKNFPT
jgi:predicted metallo-beta-lactamase superfamily hydrolase